MLRELDRMRAESEKQKQHIAEQQRLINRLHGSVAMSGIPKKSSSGSDLLKVLRKDLMEAQQKVESIKVLLNEKLPTEAKTSRAGYLRTLPEHGVSVLLVDHDMGLVLGVCDRVVVLDVGAVIADGTPEQIRGDEGVVEAYLGAAPS